MLPFAARVLRGAEDLGAKVVDQVGPIFDRGRSRRRLRAVRWNQERLPAGIRGPWLPSFLRSLLVQASLKSDLHGLGAALARRGASADAWQGAISLRNLLVCSGWLSGLSYPWFTL